jgi:hypothetical protein
VSGTVTLEVLDPQGSDHVVEMGNDIFNAVVTSFKIRDENDDGVYEPGTTQTLYDITRNTNGAMNMPAGCVATVVQVRDFTLALCIETG